MSAMTDKLQAHIAACDAEITRIEAESVKAVAQQRGRKAQLLTIKDALEKNPAFEALIPQAKALDLL